MTKDINNILNKPYVSKGEFKVPEGYFESLSQRIMDNIPEMKANKQKPVANKVLFMPARLKYAIAACLTGLVVIGGAFTIMQKNNAESTAVAEQSVSQDIITDQYAQDCMDYAMVDEGDMYSFISEL